MSCARCRLVAGISGAFLLITLAASAQELGHKVPGFLGLDAGRIPQPGLYLIDRFAIFQANELRNNSGGLVPTGPFDFRASANGFGVEYVKKITQRPLFLSMAISGPISRLSLKAPDVLQTDAFAFGMSDPYIMPFSLGWRQTRSEELVAYGIYIPTGKSALAGGKGLSSGDFTHEFDAGGSLYSKNRAGFLTGLASYQLYTRQRGIDIKRGNSVQIQGGGGTELAGGLLETGVATYALWQVQNHSGTALPAVLRNTRDRVYGLGPEVAVLLKPVRGQVRLRYEWDLGVRSRPQGHIFVAEISFQVRR